MACYRKTVQDLFVMQNAQCPSCGQRANIKVSVQKESMIILLVPLTFPWGIQYYGTCGSCFAIFRLPKKETERLLAEYKQSSP